MSGIDVIIIALVVIGMTLSLRYILKRREEGGCVGCDHCSPVEPVKIHLKKKEQ